MPRKSTRREDNGKTMPIKRAGLCSVIGAALYFIGIAAFSAAELHMSLGAKTYLPAGIVAAFISAFTAGFIALLKYKQKALPLGAFAGALQAAVCDVLLVIINNGAVGKGLILNFAACVAGSVIGAVAAANIKSRVRY